MVQEKEEQVDDKGKKKKTKGISSHQVTQVKASFKSLL